MSSDGPPGEGHCAMYFVGLFHVILSVQINAFFHCVAAAKSLQSCPTLCDPIDGSPPGSPVPGIFQARTLECVAISFSIHCVLVLYMYIYTHIYTLYYIYR